MPLLGVVAVVDHDHVGAGLAQCDAVGGALVEVADAIAGGGEDFGANFKAAGAAGGAEEVQLDEVARFAAELELVDFDAAGDAALEDAAFDEGGGGGADGPEAFEADGVGAGLGVVAVVNHDHVGAGFAE